MTDNSSENDAAFINDMHTSLASSPTQSPSTNNGAAPVALDLSSASSSSSESSEEPVVTKIVTPSPPKKTKKKRSRESMSVAKMLDLDAGVDGSTGRDEEEHSANSNDQQFIADDAEAVEYDTDAEEEGDTDGAGVAVHRALDAGNFKPLEKLSPTTKRRQLNALEDKRKRKSSSGSGSEDSADDDVQIVAETSPSKAKSKPKKAKKKRQSPLVDMNTSGIVVKLLGCSAMTTVAALIATWTLESRRKSKHGKQGKKAALANADDVLASIPAQATTLACINSICIDVVPDLVDDALGFSSSATSTREPDCIALLKHTQSAMRKMISFERSMRTTQIENNKPKKGSKFGALVPLAAALALDVALNAVVRADDRVTVALALSPCANGLDHKALFGWLQKANVVTHTIADPQNHEAWRQTATRFSILPTHVSDAPVVKKSPKKTAEKETHMKVDALVDKLLDNFGEVDSDDEAVRDSMEMMGDGALSPQPSPDVSMAKVDRETLRASAPNVEPEAAPEPRGPIPLPRVVESGHTLGASEEACFKWDATSLLRQFSNKALLLPNGDFSNLIALMHRELLNGRNAGDIVKPATLSLVFKGTDGKQQPTNLMASIFSCARSMDSVEEGDKGDFAAVVQHRKRRLDDYISGVEKRVTAISAAHEIGIAHVLFGFLRMDKRANIHAGEPALVLNSRLEPSNRHVELGPNELPMGTGVFIVPTQNLLLEHMWTRYLEFLGVSPSAEDFALRFDESRARAQLPESCAFFSRYWNSSFVPSIDERDTYHRAMLPVMFSLFPPALRGNVHARK